jgi:hypothetical protein
MKMMSFTMHISLVPLTVASSMEIPRSRSSSASAVDICGSAVDASTTINPLRALLVSFSVFFTTSFTIAELGNESMIASTFSGICSGGIVLPPAFTSVATFSASLS